MNTSIAGTAVENYIEYFKTFETQHNGRQEGALQAQRRLAMETFARQGFPTLKDEEWRFTNLGNLLETGVHPLVSTRAVECDQSLIAPYLFNDWPGAQLVFINGVYSDQLSVRTESELPLASLRKILESGQYDSELLPQLLMGEDAFGYLNAMFMMDGVLIDVPDNLNVAHPVHILYLNTASGQPRGIFPRNIMRIGRNARLSVVESYASLDDNSNFTNTFSQIALQDNAELNHHKIQNESLNGFHFGNTFIDMARDARYTSGSITFGGRLVRNNISARLNGPGAEATLNGLYMGHNSQHIDNHTRIDHVAPNCASHELYQGILNDQARGVFSGKIMVHPDAQKTDAKQSNNCLLLSDDAKIDSKPQLEIYADDVRCTHGATVGQLDAEAIFYLQSRGIPHQKARNILTYSFAERVIEGIREQQVRDYVDGILLRRFREDMNFVK